MILLQRRGHNKLNPMTFFVLVLFQMLSLCFLRVSVVYFGMKHIGQVVTHKFILVYF